MMPLITIIGCGPGSEEYLTAQAVRAAENAEVLIGAPKLLHLFSKNEAKKIPITSELEKTLDEIGTHRRFKCAVLVTGDSGIFSFAKRIIDRFGIDNCRVIPGISAVQLAFARIGIDWADARIISLHHHLPDGGMIDNLLLFEKIAVLMGHKESFKWVHSLAQRLNAPFRMVVCENLSSADEHVLDIQPDELISRQFSCRSIVLIFRERSIL
jgi:precorrin-6y C5,15-methyltransferase (decarboxylating) CbiE subunit